MRFKLFISDYDGTLGVAPENNIHPETLSAINKFIEKGGIFTVCSGRETSSITRILREHNLKGLVVSFQGARISDIESGKFLFDGGLKKEQAVELIEALRDKNLIPLVYTGDSFFYQERNDYIKFYEKAVRLTGSVKDVSKEIQNLENGVCKICWLGDDETVVKTAKEMNEVFKDKGIKFNSGAKNLLEAINANCGKGQAIKYIANYYNIPLDKVIAVGDSTNDIELVGGEWYGVAVGDGKDEVKAVAKEVTVPFKDKPVKVLLEKYCLND